MGGDPKALAGEAIFLLDLFSPSTIRPVHILKKPKSADAEVLPNIYGKRGCTQTLYRICILLDTFILHFFFYKDELAQIGCVLSSFYFHFFFLSVRET